MTQVRRYTFKLYPNQAQEGALVRQATLLAHLWNAALEQREIQWDHECQRKAKGERRGLSWYDQKRDGKHIRADDTEYAAMSASSMELCLLALDDAFKAFFRRAKAGAGKSSGYPRYKSPYAIEHKGADCTIWHRDGSGWKMSLAGKHFTVYAKGIPGTLKARGKFPVALDDLEVRDMRLIRVGGVWQLSVVVKMEERRAIAPGAPSATIEFNLIDEFATVKTGANGQSLSGWEAPCADERSQSLAGASGELDETSRAPVRDGRYRVCARANSRSVSTRAPVRDGRDDVRHGCLVQSQLARPCEHTDEIQSDRDTRYKKFSSRWRKEKRRIAKLKAREARQRKEALHRWTTKLVASVSELTVVCPPIKDATRTARGDEKSHGAAVKTVAMLNRHVLAQAPAMAIQMLEYKAAEAGLPPIVRINPDEHALAIGRDLPAATKAARKARRELRSEAA